ncbi:transglycosylase domain-containing protein [Nanoarchaeota archaeon]
MKPKTKKVLKIGCLSTVILGGASLAGGLYTLKYVSENQVFEKNILPVALETNHMRPEKGPYWDKVHKHRDISKIFNPYYDESKDQSEIVPKTSRNFIQKSIEKQAINVPKIPTDMNSHYSTRYYTKDGELIFEYKPKIVTLDDIPDILEKSVILTEDDDFYHHRGINVYSIARAATAIVKDSAKASWKYKRPKIILSQGGSTITQQLVKNKFLLDKEDGKAKKTWTRKKEEAIAAVQVEHLFTKDMILEDYFNFVYFGGKNGEVGVQAACNYLLNKDVQDLDIAESALMASIISKPGYFIRNPEDLKIKRDHVLKRMKEFDVITQEQLEIALNKDVKFVKNVENPFHPLVRYVNHELKTKFNINPYEFQRYSNLDIYTTFDLSLQDSIQNRANEFLVNFDKGHTDFITKKKVKPYADIIKEIKDTLPKDQWIDAIAKVKKQNYTDVTGVVIEYDTGAILAMLDSGRKYNFYEKSWKSEFPLGSTVKQFIYLRAFELGLIDLDTILYDYPIIYNSGEIQKLIFEGVMQEKICLDRPLIKDKDQRKIDAIEDPVKKLEMIAEIKNFYVPEDFSEPRGEVTVEKAFTSSINIPAIRLVAKDVEIIYDEAPVKDGVMAKVLDCGKYKYYKSLDLSYYGMEQETIRRIANGVGLDSVVELAKKLGLTNLGYDDTVYLGSILGFSEGDTMLNLATATGAMANNGVKVEPFSIMYIKDKNNNIIYEPDIISHKVFTNQIALNKLNTLMKKNYLKGTAANFKRNFTGKIGEKSMYIEAGAKTGTTDDYEKALLTGFVDNIKGSKTAFAFVTGYDFSKPMGKHKKFAGGSLVAPFVGNFYYDWFNSKQEYIFTVKKPITLMKAYDIADEIILPTLEIVNIIEEEFLVEEESDDMFLFDTFEQDSFIVEDDFEILTPKMEKTKPKILKQPEFDTDTLCYVDPYKECEGDEDCIMRLETKISIFCDE